MTLSAMATPFASPPPQAGSQHRSKAEPAGAVVGGKWVADKPKPEQMTLMGACPCSAGGHCRLVLVLCCGRVCMRWAFCLTSWCDL